MVKLMKPACQAGRGKEQGNVNRPSFEGEGNVVLGNEVSPWWRELRAGWWEERNPARSEHA